MARPLPRSTLRAASRLDSSKTHGSERRLRSRTLLGRASAVTESGTGTASFLVFPTHGSPAQYRESATTTTPGVAATAAPDTAADATDHLRLGSYWIVEQSPAGGPAGGWTLTTVNCGGVLVPFAQGAVEVKLTPAHPRLRCVYTDTLSAIPLPPLPPVNPPLVEPPPAPVFPLVPGLPAYQLSDLVVTKQASASIVTQGGVVAYRITIKNLGPSPAQHVVLADQPLGHAPFVAVQTSAGHCKARLRTAVPITCGLGTLQPGSKVTVTVRLRIETPRLSSQTQPSPAPRRKSKRSPTTSPARA